MSFGDFDVEIEGDCTDCGAYYCGMGLKPPCSGCKYEETSPLREQVPP